MLCTISVQLLCKNLYDYSRIHLLLWIARLKQLRRRTLVSLQQQQIPRSLGLCIGAQHRYNIYREVGAADMPIFPRYIGEISAAERSEAAEPHFLR